jgi:hypothetical protein
MEKPTDMICIKRWQAFVLLTMTGFACGTIIAKTVGALGF